MDTDLHADERPTTFEDNQFWIGVYSTESGESDRVVLDHRYRSADAAAKEADDYTRWFRREYDVGEDETVHFNVIPVSPDEAYEIDPDGLSAENQGVDDWLGADATGDNGYGTDDVVEAAGAFVEALEANFGYHDDTVVVKQLSVAEEQEHLREALEACEAQPRVFIDARNLLNRFEASCKPCEEHGVDTTGSFVEKEAIDQYLSRVQNHLDIEGRDSYPDLATQTYDKTHESDGLSP